MNVVFLNNGVRLGRDNGDKPIRKESTVVFHLLKVLNAAGGPGHWCRFYPNRHGLTDCRCGVRNNKTGAIYWHENYQIESAYEEFNGGAVYFNKA